MSPFSSWTHKSIPEITLLTSTWVFKISRVLREKLCRGSGRHFVYVHIINDCNNSSVCGPLRHFVFFLGHIVQWPVHKHAQTHLGSNYMVFFCAKKKIRQDKLLKTFWTINMANNLYNSVLIQQANESKMSSYAKPQERTVKCHLGTLKEHFVISPNEVF